MVFTARPFHIMWNAGDMTSLGRKKEQDNITLCKIRRTSGMGNLGIDKFWKNIRRAINKKIRSISQSYKKEEAELTSYC